MTKAKRKASTDLICFRLNDQEKKEILHLAVHMGSPGKPVSKSDVCRDLISKKYKRVMRK
tara:strand:+ start:294 stop:473 length:180 start_codon:yes stop_codon:yes gene_type:complete